MMMRNRFTRWASGLLVVTAVAGLAATTAQAADVEGREVSSRAAVSCTARRQPADRARCALDRLTTSLQIDAPKYERKFFQGGPRQTIDWIDADKDCQDTRTEVLIDDANAGTLASSLGCTLNAGDGVWTSPYDGVTITDPRLVDIDHMVPLGNAWIAGAYLWTQDKRVNYANWLLDDAHLIAVTQASNRSKSDRSPASWKPKLTSYWCQYAIDWVNVKTRWELTVSPGERIELGKMLDTCPTRPVRGAASARLEGTDGGPRDWSRVDPAMAEAVVTDDMLPTDSDVAADDAVVVADAVAAADAVVADEATPADPEPMVDESPGS